jgi:hypothetical protein
MEGAVMQARTHRNNTIFDDSVAAPRYYFLLRRSRELIARVIP